MRSLPTRTLKSTLTTSFPVASKKVDYFCQPGLELNKHIVTNGLSDIHIKDMVWEVKRHTLVLLSLDPVVLLFLNRDVPKPPPSEMDPDVRGEEIW